MEYLRVMRAAWEVDGPVSFDGEFVSFGPVGTLPHPAGRLPVWIGGKGDRPLRRAVELGDGYLAISSDPDLLRAEVDRLRAIAESAGRDPSTLTVGLIDGIAVHDRPLDGSRPLLHGTTEQIAEGLAAYGAAGLDHLVAGIRLAGESSYAGAVAAMSTVARDLLDPTDGSGTVRT